MSDLEFISSDEEGETSTPSLASESVPVGSSEGKDKAKGKESGGKRKNKDTAKSKAKKAAPVESSSDEEESDDEFGNDFDFAGLQDDDGSNDLSSIIGNNNSSSGEWSYKHALKILEQNDGEDQVERTNVASIIAAARKNMKMKEDEEEQEKEKEESGNDNDNDTEEDGKSASDSNDDSDSNTNSNDDSASDGEDSDSDGDSSDDEVDDTQHAKSMEDDELKDRKINRRDAGKVVEDKDADNEEEDSDSEDEEEREDEEAKQERIKAAKFFDSSSNVTSSKSGGKGTKDDATEVFAQLNLSRPLLRGVASMGFVTPTPIQSRCIPIALSGRDICASAQTGSGKTAAFLLPIMERILQRGGGKVSMKSQRRGRAAHNPTATRGLILTPTRELAAQCIGMMAAMAKFTDMRATLIVGGAKNVNGQAAELRTRPDIVVATPGRLLDHVTNSQGVDLDDLEFLILDEADRLLDLGFQDEIHEIVKACPIERQTLLFSATMGTKVDDLIKLSLKRPVRIHVTTKQKSADGFDDDGQGGVEVANRLEQEFVRVRAQNEGVNRQAMLLALLTRTFTGRTIVFFDTKSAAHRMMIIAGLCGIKVAELHGNLTQVQRLEALESFREGSVDVLLATDLAARGLDISSLEAVINFEMPSSVDTYVHRIGRTARAGRGGKACTLIGESRRPLMKAVMKDAEQKRKMVQKEKTQGNTNTSGTIRSRTIPTAVLKHFAAKVISLEPHYHEVIAAEAVAKMDRLAEMEANKASNLIRHGSDIASRPRREWFASDKRKEVIKEKAAEKQKMIAEKVGTGLHRMSRKKRRLREAKEMVLEMQQEAREEFEESGVRMPHFMTDDAQKLGAKAMRREQQEKQAEYEQKSMYEEDMEKKKKRQLKEKKAKKRKGAFASDTLGDSGLFEDSAVVYSKKEDEAEKRPGASAFEFKGFDPNGPKRKHKARGHHKFKSKSKHKRRK